jgi:hypothetical protein
MVQECSALFEAFSHLHVSSWRWGPLAAQTTATRSKAPDFRLDTPTGDSISLAKEQVKGTLVLVLLRGFSRVSVPYCVKQMQHSADFAAKKVTVVLVYPDRQPISISMPRSSSQSNPICHRTQSW